MRTFRFAPLAAVVLLAACGDAEPSASSGTAGGPIVDGSDGLGRLNAGLFFIAYQRDPRTAFIPVQRSLARSDEMNEYLRHVSSGLFACPPGVTAPDDFWGRALFG